MNRAPNKSKDYPDTTRHVRDAAFRKFMDELAGTEFRMPELLRTAFLAGWAARQATHNASILEEVKHD